MSYSPE
jgi:hypothetical protein